MNRPGCIMLSMPSIPSTLPVMFFDISLNNLIGLLIVNDVKEQGVTIFPVVLLCKNANSPDSSLRNSGCRIIKAIVACVYIQNVCSAGTP